MCGHGGEFNEKEKQAMACFSFSFIVPLVQVSRLEPDMLLVS
jgi:hypothetical protein